MNSQRSPEVNVALISGVFTLGATVVTVLGTAFLQQRPESGLAQFICSNTISDIQKPLVERLKTIENENTKLKKERELLSEELDRLKTTPSGPSQLSSGDTSRGSSNSIQSGGFKVTPRIHQKILNGEIILENFEIYQGINPRINYVGFDLNYLSQNIPDRLRHRITLVDSFEFSHRGRRYKLFAEEISPEDSTASLTLKPIN
ncbi:hypothetical protein [Synechococcus sp. FACHB-909]|uniref:hypothetical protein n=1 Tax=Synechococcus sp. FACHB-909 TaxID=2692863 RepID=UPI001684B854|nr:hypothetical protein [Synechococcus sp. FACHB-909]MBD2720238.1 hypothetical protein [Synechococcus sp. FACHB-909]